MCQEKGVYLLIKTYTPFYQKVLSYFCKRIFLFYEGNQSVGWSVSTRAYTYQ